MFRWQAITKRELIESLEHKIKVQLENIFWFVCIYRSWLWRGYTGEVGQREVYLYGAKMGLVPYLSPPDLWFHTSTTEEGIKNQLLILAKGACKPHRKDCAHLRMWTVSVHMCTCVAVG